MPKKNPKNKWQVWLIAILIIFGIFWFFGVFDIFSSNSGEKQLKENYEVSNFFCVNSGAGVEMKSLGNRQEQVTDGLIYLYKDCQTSESYYITILEPTKSCQYSFNGEIIKLWYNSIGQDNFVISEASKRIIESDIGFTLWKSFAKLSYEFKIKNGISQMTDSQLGLALGYEDYLENGITKSTLIHIIVYEANNPLNCE